MMLNGQLALSYCSGGRNYLRFSPTIPIMPCHRLVGEEEFQVGLGLPSSTPASQNGGCPSTTTRTVPAAGCATLRRRLQARKLCRDRIIERTESRDVKVPDPTR